MSISRILISAAFVFGSLSSTLAQTDSASNTFVAQQMQFSTASSVYFAGNANYNSDFFNAGKFVKLASAKTISNAVVTDLLANRNNKNRAWYFDDFQIGGSYKLSKFTLKAGLCYSNYLYAQFDSTLLQLASYGNTPYKGQTLDIYNSKLLYFNQSGLNVGISKSFNTSKIIYFVEANIQLLQSSNFNRLNLYNTSLYTEDNAEYIDLSYNYGYAIQQKGTPLDGKGMQGGARFLMYLKNKGGFELGFSRLGFIRFNNSHFKSAQNSGNQRFDAINVPYENIANFGNNDTLNKQIKQFQDKLYPTEVSQQYTFHTPLSLHCKLFSHVGENGLLQGNLLYVNRFTQNLIYTLSYSHRLPKNLLVAANIANGAFGAQGLGLGFGYSHQKLSARADVNGLVNFNKSMAPLSAINIRIAYLL
ncbi:hypothetical protein GC194_14540 [bacterium]|nr:hypothetical protein [bacterium]